MNPWLRRYAYILAIIVISTLAIAPTPQPSTMRSVGADSGWALPSVAPMPANYAGTVRDLAQSKLWGGQVDVAAGANDLVSRWRIAGVTGQRNERYVIIQFGDDRIQQLKAKDQFPDGTVIVEVRENGVCVMLQGKRRLLPLDGQAPTIIW
ncbi:MAG: hypothetical protein ACK45Y_08370 [Betaproteobacteria bacterium]|jgi:hypothetical protein|nr:hypothetical protein AEM42_03015 [Betaproteobacteria bacterium UKL13-2]